jgi:hypothetical protein
MASTENGADSFKRALGSTAGEALSDDDQASACS